MSVRIKDIAREAGVSIGTVDRVLHDREGVSEKTKKKVNEVIERLGYKPNVVARALVLKGKKNRIGIIYPKVEVQFWDEVSRGIEDERKRLAPYGVEIVVRTTKSYELSEQLAAIDDLEKDGISGIVMMAYHPEKTVERIDELFGKNIPVATFISDAPLSKRICFSGIDNYKSGEVAASLMNLYLRGDGKIAIIGIHREVKAIEDRIKGFIEKTRESDDNIKVVSILNAKDHLKENNTKFRQTVRRMASMVIEENRDLKGIYVTNSLTCCVGSVVSEKNLTGQIKIIGHEDTRDNLEMIRAGVVHGIVYENQYEQVVNSIKSVSEFLMGNQDINSTQLVDIGIKIKENS